MKGFCAAFSLSGLLGFCMLSGAVHAQMEAHCIMDGQNGVGMWQQKKETCIQATYICKSTVAPTQYVRSIELGLKTKVSAWHLAKLFAFCSIRVLGWTWVLTVISIISLPSIDCYLCLPYFLGSFPFLTPEFKCGLVVFMFHLCRQSLRGKPTEC